jgi:cell division protein FtsL
MSDAVSRTIPRLPAFPLNRPRLLPLFTFIVALLVVALFFVWSRLQVIHLEYDISSLEGRVRHLQHEMSMLRVEAASLRNPGRIERVARNELGLRFPAPEQVIVIEE